MQAIKRYPTRLDWERWCRNGDIPDAALARLFERYQNHIMAWRRKVIFEVCGDLLGATSAIGATDADTTYWRSRFHSGHGASEIRFRLLCGRSRTQPPHSPRVEIDVTEVGGGTTTLTINFGNFGDDYVNVTDAPDELVEFRRGVSILADTDYTVAVRGIGGGRPVAVDCYEYADPEVDDDRNYFIEIGPSGEFPIYDLLRQRLTEGLSQMFLANGAHLITFAGLGDGSARSITGTTWTNLIDGSSTSVSASTPGYDFDNESDGGALLETLLPLCRLSAGNDLPITLAVFGNTSAGSTGEFRLEGSGGTACSITGITTTLQWHTTDTTLQNVDSITKVDPQLRNGTGGQTTNVYAVSVYTR